MLNLVVMAGLMALGLWLTLKLGWSFADPGFWGFLIACPVAGLLVWAFQEQPKK